MAAQPKRKTTSKRSDSKLSKGPMGGTGFSDNDDLDGTASNDDQASVADDRANTYMSGEDPSTVTRVDQDAGSSTL